MSGMARGGWEIPYLALVLVAFPHLQILVCESQGFLWVVVVVVEP